MNTVLEFLSSVKFDAILLVVTAGFAVFAQVLLTQSARRDDSMAQVLRNRIAALESIPPAKRKARAARSK